jgi:hypothetical protein
MKADKLEEKIKVEGVKEKEEGRKMKSEDCCCKVTSEQNKKTDSWQNSRPEVFRGRTRQKDGENKMIIWVCI